MTKQIATFDQLGRDLYWKIYDPDDGLIRWTGYDDNYWWDNVSASDKFTKKTGPKTGRIFELDASMGEVRVIDAALAETEKGDE